mgnify:FL=1
MDTHDDAMRLVSEAELLTLEGLLENGPEKPERAAEAEERAANAVPEDRPRTRGILRVSAVSLWLQAGRPAQAAMLAERYLAEPLAAEFARELDELRVHCVRDAKAAERLPVVDAVFAVRAREREASLAMGEIASGAVVDTRAA